MSLLIYLYYLTFKEKQNKNRKRKEKKKNTKRKHEEQRKIISQLQEIRMTDTHCRILVSRNVIDCRKIDC